MKNIKKYSNLTQSDIDNISDLFLDISDLLLEITGGDIMKSNSYRISTYPPFYECIINIKFNNNVGGNIITTQEFILKVKSFLSRILKFGYSYNLTEKSNEMQPFDTTHRDWRELHMIIVINKY